MISSFFTSPLLALVLYCTTPSLAFIGVNYIRFSRRQSINSIGICLLCALILSPLFVLLPPVLSSVFICFLFCIFSEKFLSLIFPRCQSKLIFFVSFSAISAFIVWQFGYAPLNFLFIIYAGFSCFDIYKNSKLPKENVFCISKSQTDKTTHGQENRHDIELKKKNDIFIFFLESMHNQEGMKTLYGMDNPVIFEYLKEKKFTVYPHAYSNACETIRSFATLINMSPYDVLPTHMPNAMQILDMNGYELQLFDSIIYPFQHIITFSHYHNMILPIYVIKLLAFATPFFAQSRYFMKLVQNIDPFDDSISNTKVLSDLKKRLAKSYDKPQCYIARMGAQHSAATHSFDKKIEEWKESYRAFYDDASNELKKAVNAILTNNPDAVIAIMGDHGAYSLRGAWNGSLHPLENLYEKGIDPLVVNLDVASVLFAVRFPDASYESEELRSPCNLFRYIFKYLGGEGKFLEHARDDTFLYTKNGICMIVDDGEPLKKWNTLTYDAYTEYKIQCISHGNPTPDTYKDIINLFESSCHIEDAMEVCEKAIAKFPDDLELRSLTISLLIRIGKIDLAEKFASSLLKKHKYDNYIYIKALQGRHAMAQQLLEDKYSYLKYPEKLRAHILCLAGERAKALESAEKHFKYTLINFRSLPTEENVSALTIYLEHLEASGQASKGLNVYRGMNKSQYPYVAYMPCLEIAYTLLALRAGDDKEYIKISKSNIGRHAMVHFLLLGILEKQGKIEELISLVEEKYDDFIKLPLGKSQLGLLAIRLQLKHPLFAVHKKEAYEDLRVLKDFFQATNIFDEVWYKEKYKHLIGHEDPLMHYLHHRTLLLLDPNPFFNSCYVYMCNYGTFCVGADPLIQLINAPILKNMSPSLHFDASHYIAKNPSILEGGSANVLMHYYANVHNEKPASLT